MYESMFVRRCAGQTLVDVDGDIDFNSAPWLQQRLLHLLRPDRPRLLVDLSGVTFIDCFATRSLAATCRRAEQQACSIRFIALSKQVQRVAELTGLAGELPVTGPSAAGPADPWSVSAMTEPTVQCGTPAVELNRGVCARGDFGRRDGIHDDDPASLPAAIRKAADLDSADCRSHVERHVNVTVMAEGTSACTRI